MFSISVVQRKPLSPFLERSHVSAISAPINKVKLQLRGGLLPLHYGIRKIEANAWLASILL